MPLREVFEEDGAGGKIFGTGIDNGDNSQGGPSGCYLAVDLGSQGIKCDSILLHLWLKHFINLFLLPTCVHFCVVNTFHSRLLQHGTG